MQNTVTMQQNSDRFVSTRSETFNVVFGNSVSARKVLLMLPVLIRFLL